MTPEQYAFWKERMEEFTEAVSNEVFMSGGQCVGLDHWKVVSAEHIIGELESLGWTITPPKGPHEDHETDAPSPPTEAGSPDGPPAGAAGDCGPSPGG